MLVSTDSLFNCTMFEDHLSGLLSSNINNVLLAVNTSMNYILASETSMVNYRRIKSLVLTLSLMIAPPFTLRNHSGRRGLVMWKSLPSSQ